METTTDKKLDLVNFNLAIQKREDLEEELLKNVDYLKKRDEFNRAICYDLMEDFAFELDHHAGQKFILHVEGSRRSPTFVKAHAILDKNLEHYEWIAIGIISKEFAKGPIQADRDRAKVGHMSVNENCFPLLADQLFVKENLGNFVKMQDRLFLVAPKYDGLELRNYAYNFLPEEKRDLIKDLFSFQGLAEKPPKITFLIGNKEVDPYLENYKTLHKTDGLPW